MSFKIAFIGAGSLIFARTLFRDLMAIPAFHNIEIAFTDINLENLQKVTELCQRELDHNRVDIRIHPTLDRREALRGARYVFNMIRVGGVEAFTKDIEIPLRHKIDQCVGDTLCVGGIMYGQRTIPVMLDICKDIREVCVEDALLLNYSNPNAMVTWACNEFGKVRTIGLCHGEMHGERQIADALGIPHEELDFICAGINHQTWYISIKHNGVEQLDKLLEAYERHPVYSKQEKVRIDMLRRFGYYSTESNGHLSEYLAWYRKRPEEIADWIDLSDWIHGETGGYLRVTREAREYFTEEYEALLAEELCEFATHQRSIEHGSYILEALELRKPYRGHFNIMNNGTITNLPANAVVEVPCYVDGNGISVPTVGDLPLGCAAVCSQSIWVQNLSVQAAVDGDDQLLRQAALLDPLTGAVLNPPEVWALIDDMLVEQAEWLPQYASVIEELREKAEA